MIDSTMINYIIVLISLIFFKFPLLHEYCRLLIMIKRIDHKSEYQNLIQKMSTAKDNTSYQPM